MIDADYINNFWDWFRVNCSHLHSDKYPNDTFGELDERLYGMGLYWEVGPGVNKENLLTISVSGQRARLDKARSLLVNAPILADWEFDLFKKPKTNWDKLEIRVIISRFRLQTGHMCC